MRIRAFVIAGVLAVLPTAFPKSAKASEYDFQYGKYFGWLGAVCELYVSGHITDDIAGEASIIIMKKTDDETKAAAKKAAFEKIRDYLSFKECPIRRP